MVDFGLARAIGEANYRKLTQTGILVGTAFYLSPEQIREDRDLDARCDIDSLGCIVYELLAGEPPYAAPSIIQLIRRIVQAPVPLVRGLRPPVETPSGLRNLLRTLRGLAG